MLVQVSVRIASEVSGVWLINPSNCGILHDLSPDHRLLEVRGEKMELRLVSVMYLDRANGLIVAVPWDARTLHHLNDTISGGKCHQQLHDYIRK